MRLRGIGSDAQRRAILDEQYAIRSAEDVAAELGEMKGLMMKAGQILSFLADGLPPAARDALATLHQDVPPMAPGLAAQVVTRELGAPPEQVFLEWVDEPVAAASIGQVHRAVTRDGRDVAVKVQYPGIDATIGGDLGNTELVYRMLSAMAVGRMDAKAIVAELRERLAEELDYRVEVANQREFARRYAGHPFIRVPDVDLGLCTPRILTSEWMDGEPFATVEGGDDASRQRAGEILFRFVQGSVYRARTFNGDAHPGNFRFLPDGTVAFLDYGMVKRWTDDEVARLWPVIDPLLDLDAPTCVRRMVDAGFLPADHGLDPELVLDYVSTPYRPYLDDTHEFTPEFTAASLRTIVDVTGPHASVLAQLDMPASFVVLDRVVWGMSAMLGRLRARNRWRAILDEYRHDAPPATELGRLERTWWETRGRDQWPPP